MKRANTCCRLGQRVQSGVSDCRLNSAQFDELKGRLLDINDPGEGPLRLYRLPGDDAKAVRVHGLTLDHG